MVSMSTCAAARWLAAPGLPACVVNDVGTSDVSLCRLSKWRGFGWRTEGSHHWLAACFGVEEDPGLGRGPEAAIEAHAVFAVEQCSQELVGAQP